MADYYASCSFKPDGSGRLYDYHVPDFLTVRAGDVVRVPASRGREGWQKVYVVETKDTTDVAPEFIKSVIELHEEEETEE